jgi:hypothetical protein
MSAVDVEAKSKARARHKRAIENYLEWEKENPNATSEEKFSMFDFLVDTKDIINFDIVA